MTHPRPTYDRVADRPAHDKAVRDWGELHEPPPPPPPPLPPDGTYLEPPEVEYIRSGIMRHLRLLAAVAALLAICWVIATAIDGAARWNQPINLEAQP